MKNTIVVLVSFIFLSILVSKEVLALTIPNIRVVTLAPTATPTPVIFKKIDSNIDLKLIATNTPIPEVKATNTPIPTQEIKVTPTEANISPSGTAPSISPEEKNVEKTEEKAESGTDLSKWFLEITVGLLILIVVIQLWPKKKEDR